MGTTTYLETPTFIDIQKAYNELQALSPKEKYKKIRTVSALAEKAIKQAVAVKELEFYSNIFKTSGDSRAINKAKAKEFELRGITDIKTVKTKLGTVNIESGLIAVGDPLIGYKQDYDLHKIVNEMNNQAFYCIGTGRDGTFDVTLRLVDIDEPLIGAKEYKFILGNSANSIIKISSGFIKCSDFVDLSNNDVSGEGYDLENGFYKVSFYLKNIKDKYFGFVIVLAKTSDGSLNNFTDIETLG